jgi:general secretion pathway protein M
MSTPAQALQEYRGRAAAFWMERTEQERRFLGVGGAVLGLALFYSLLISPALDGRAKLRKELPELRQQAAELQSLALEAASLRGQNTIAPAPMTGESLKSGMSARGLVPQSVAITGEYAKVQLNGAPFAAVVTWLDAVRSESRITVQDANFVAQDTAGMVNATLTLHQNAGGR